MSNPIYPKIVPGLKVRHRETLEERTVEAVEPQFVQTEDASTVPKYFWTYYEPLPQPGDRVRVVRISWGPLPQPHRGEEGILREAQGEYRIDGWCGPLSDFEVILPEESEQNMTDNETVAVPVELLKRIRRSLDDDDPGAWVQLEALIPKPKPRLVAVDLGDGHDRWYKTDLDAQPDLLETLDGVIDRQLIRQFAKPIKDAIREALGVNES